VPEKGSLQGLKGRFTFLTSKQTIEVDFLDLKAMIHKCGHDRSPDVLKMDIERWEFDVFEKLIEDGDVLKSTSQLLVEWHHRFFEEGVGRTLKLLKKLDDEFGFKVIAHTRDYQETTLLRVDK